jgi:hypothetical protein
LENRDSAFKFLRACLPAPMLKIWPGRSCNTSTDISQILMSFALHSKRKKKFKSVDRAL